MGTNKDVFVSQNDNKTVHKLPTTITQHMWNYNTPHIWVIDSYYQTCTSLKTDLHVDLVQDSYLEYA